MVVSLVPNPAIAPSTLLQGIANSMARPVLDCRNVAAALKYVPTCSSSTWFPAICEISLGAVFPSQVAQNKSGAKPSVPVVSKTKLRRQELSAVIDASPRPGALSISSTMLLPQIRPSPARYRLSLSQVMRIWLMSLLTPHLESSVASSSAPASVLNPKIDSSLVKSPVKPSIRMRADRSCAVRACAPAGATRSRATR